MLKFCEATLRSNNALALYFHFHTKLLVCSCRFLIIFLPRYVLLSRLSFSPFIIFLSVSSFLLSVFPYILFSSLRLFSHNFLFHLCCFLPTLLFFLSSLFCIRFPFSFFSIFVFIFASSSPSSFFFSSLSPLCSLTTVFSLSIALCLFITLPSEGFLEFSFIEERIFLRFSPFQRIHRFHEIINQKINLYAKHNKLFLTIQLYLCKQLQID